MADLTSTLTISGSVNGKKINVSHTYTMEDVYDAGTHDRSVLSVSPSIYSGDNPGGNEITFNQDTPNYFMIVNKDTHGVAKAVIGTLELYLTPGMFFVLTGTAGLYLTTSTDTDFALVDVSGVTVEPVTPFPSGSIQLLAAFNALS